MLMDGRFCAPVTSLKCYGIYRESATAGFMAATAAPASTMPAPQVSVSHGRVAVDGNGCAVDCSTATTSSGVIAGFTSYRSATVPVTWGVAILGRVCKLRVGCHSGQHERPLIVDVTQGTSHFPRSEVTE